MTTNKIFRIHWANVLCALSTTALAVAFVVAVFHWEG